MSDKKIKEINKLFKKYGITGIVHIPEFGVFTNFDDNGSTLEILQRAEIEKRVIEKGVDMEVEERVFDYKNSFNYSNGNREYIR